MTEVREEMESTDDGENHWQLKVTLDKNHLNHREDCKSNNILFSRTKQREKSSASLWFQPLWGGDGWGAQAEETEEVWQLNCQPAETKDNPRWDRRGIPSWGLVHTLLPQTDGEHPECKGLTTQSDTVNGSFTVWCLSVKVPLSVTKELM